MKKNIFLFLLMHCILLAQGQKRELSFLTKFQYLYQENNEKSHKIGALAAGAEVYFLKNVSNGFSLVEATNGDKGYVNSSVIAEKNRGYKDENEPKKYFYRGSQGYQCPHQYIQTSGLRVRKEPNTQSKIIKVLGLNQMICNNYFPFDKEGWINIGNVYHGENGYIQYKNLGEELTYEKVFTDYEQSIGKPEEKNQVERLVEIGWDSTEKQNLESLNIYKNYCLKFNKLEALEKLNFEIFLLENMQNHYESSDTLQTHVKYDFKLRNQPIKLGNLRENQMNTLGIPFVKSKDFSDLQECGIDPFVLYKTEDITMIFEKWDGKKEFATIIDFKFKNGNSVLINDFEINENTSEREFIKKFGKIFNIHWKTDPHQYRFADGDAGFAVITFKDGKPVSFQNSFYC